MAGATRASRKTQEIAFPLRGDIYLVSFDPTVGSSEIRKTRPALVIQNDTANEYSPLTIVAALTSKFDLPAYPTEVILESNESGLLMTSAVLLNQIHSVDKRRLLKRMGKASAEGMRRVDQAILISLGMVKI